MTVYLTRFFKLIGIRKMCYGVGMGLENMAQKYHINKAGVCNLELSLPPPSDRNLRSSTAFPTQEKAEKTN